MFADLLSLLLTFWVVKICKVYHCHLKITDILEVVMLTS